MSDYTFNPSQHPGRSKVDPPSPEQSFRMWSYVAAVLFPLAGIICALRLAVVKKYEPIRRHAIAVGVISVLAMVAYGGVITYVASSHQDTNVAADLRGILDSNNIAYTSVDGCTHETGDQYLCTVTTDATAFPPGSGTTTVTVTDDGKGYAYEQGLGN